MDDPVSVELDTKDPKVIPPTYEKKAIEPFLNRPDPTTGFTIKGFRPNQNLKNEIDQKIAAIKTELAKHTGKVTPSVSSEERSQTIEMNANMTSYQFATRSFATANPTPSSLVGNENKNTQNESNSNSNNSTAVVVSEVTLTDDSEKDLEKDSSVPMQNNFHS